MEGILTKVLLVVAAIFIFAVVIVTTLQPTIVQKGEDVKTSITGTKLDN